MTRHLAEASDSPIAFVVGEALVDIVVTPTGHKKFVGGSPVNVACGLARLSMVTSLRTQIGDDENGWLIQDHLVAEGVQLHPGSVGANRTSTAIARIQPDGRAEYVFDVAWRAAQIAPPPGVQFIHTGSIASALAPGAADIVALFGRAADRVVYSFDPNIRPGVLGSRIDVLASTEAIAAFSHIVKMSDEDAAWLHPNADLDAVIERYLDHGASIVVITRAADGCIVASQSARVTRRPAPVDVVDTIGGGDAFMSGMLFAVKTLGLTDSVLDGHVAEADLTAIATIASESARLVVSRAGAQPPTLLELMARLSDTGFVSEGHPS